MFFAIRHKGGEVQVFNLTISSNQSRWNLLAEIGHTPTIPVTVNITVNAGVLIRDQVMGSPNNAMNLAGLPIGSIINLTNNGYIQGQGGAGGNGGSTGVGGNGANAGKAINGPGTGRTFTIINASGNIWGGGGGGGGGAANDTVVGGEPAFAPGGGGGGGAGGSAGGPGGNNIGFGDDGEDGTDGTSGSSGDPGVGGDGATHAGVTGGDGASGGNWGANGAAGSGAGGTLGGSAGTGGKAIDLNGGSVTFTSGASSPNVKGAVS